MLTINAEIRNEQGKSACRRLRKNNKLPIIVYGNKQKPILLTLNHDDIINNEHHLEFYKTLTLIYNNKNIKVVIQAIQRHQYKPKFIHIDFLQQI